MHSNWLWSALAVVTLAAPASAQEACNKPLKIVNTLPMTVDASGRFTFPIGLNGMQKQFLLDTGGMYMQISDSLARELKLAQRQSPVQLIFSNGAKSDHYVEVENVAIGRLVTPKMQMQVTPGIGDGVFPPLLFKGYDFEMDFAGGKLNMMSPDHCDGKVVYWPSRALAVVPIDTKDYHIVVPVMLDGHRLMAELDTGARSSTMRSDIAERELSLEPNSPGMTAVSHMLGDEKAIIYKYPFKSLSFEGVSVTDPDVKIVHDIVAENVVHALQTGNIKRASDDTLFPQLVVGMDVLRHLHIYLANGEHKLYITEATAPAPEPAAK